MFDRTSLAVTLPLVVLLAACGKPMERPGTEDAAFMPASMAGMPTPTGADRPLASDLAVEPVSMLVMFNRLKTAEALQDALNKKPGQFSHLDIDRDSAPDPLTVAARETPQGHAFEIRARPSSGEFVVATMVFDPEWSFLGHYNGVLGGAASTFARPLPASPAIAVATPALAGSVQAAPAASGDIAGAAAQP